MSNISVNRRWGEFSSVPLDQAICCIMLCQDLTSKELSIHFLKFDQFEQMVYILAGRNINVQVRDDGEWRFLG